MLILQRLQPSIPLKDIPSTVASKVASSTNVDTAEMTAFHSSEPDVFAEKTKSITYN